MDLVSLALLNSTDDVDSNSQICSPCLERLTLFEDFNEDLNAAFREPRGNPYPENFARVPKSSVDTALAKVSLCLE